MQALAGADVEFRILKPLFFERPEAFEHARKAPPIARPQAGGRLSET